MRINIINDEKNFRFLYIELQFPRISKVDNYNEWTDDHFTGFKMSFPTELFYLLSIFLGILIKPVILNIFGIFFLKFVKGHQG